MAEPRASIVVPTYGRADHLEALLDVLQRWKDRVEVVVVDDGSPDRTPDVLAGRPWVRGVRQDNAGAAAARNRGWREAQGEWILFLDDDCVPDERWLDDTFEAIDAAPDDVGGLGGQVRSVAAGALDRYVEVERLVDHGRDLDDGGVDYLITANATYRREALDAVDGFDERFPGAAAEDVDLSWRIRGAGWNLRRGGGTVSHHHRSTLREVVRTYRNHGAGRAHLEVIHPDVSTGGAAGRALAPSAWLERFGSYRRSGVSLPGSLGLVGLRVVGLGAFAVGLVGGRRRR